MIRRFNGVAVQPQFEEGILNNSVHYKIILQHLPSNPEKKSFVAQVNVFQSGRIAFFQQFVQLKIAQLSRRRVCSFHKWHFLFKQLAIASVFILNIAQLHSDNLLYKYKKKIKYLGYIPIEVLCIYCNLL